MTGHFFKLCYFLYVEFQDVSATPHRLPALTPGPGKICPRHSERKSSAQLSDVLDSAMRRLNAFLMQLPLLHKEMRSAKTLSFVFSLTNSRITMSQNSRVLENWQKETCAFKELSPQRIRGRAEEEP